MAEYILWFKALHIISFVAWMAGMFYLPRLYVYHTRVQNGSEADQLFQTMERKLLRLIINPAMIATFVFGICLIVANTAYMQQGWLHAKFTLLLLMVGFHGFLARARRDFAEGRNKRSEKFYRLINEIPTVLLIGIVLLAVLRPF